MRAMLVAVAGLAGVAVAVAATPAHAGTGAALVRYLPDNASEILAIDVAHARTGGALDDVITQLRAHSPRWEAVAADGVLLDRAIDTLVVAITPDNGPQRHTIAIVDGMVGPILAHLKRPNSPATEHAGVTFWSIDGGEVAIVDHHLVITTTGDMAATIDRARRKAIAQPSSLETLREILAATEGTGADVSGGMILPASERVAAAQQLGGEPMWLAFAIAASVRASLDVRIACADEAAAHALVASLQKLVVGPDAQVRPSLQMMIGPEFTESLAIDQDRAQIRLTASMPREEADHFVNLLAGNL